MKRLLAAVVIALFAVIALSGQNATELDRHIAAARAVGQESVSRFLTVANECAQAAIAALPS